MHTHITHYWTERAKALGWAQEDRARGHTSTARGYEQRAREYETHIHYLMRGA